MQNFKVFFAGIVVLFLIVQTGFAGTTGKIAGTIKDSKTGEPLIGAEIVLDGTSLGASTDIDGYFVIINVPPGNYNLTAYYVGYANLTIENIRVNTDRTTTQNIDLAPALVEGEAVVVQAERSAIEMDRTHTAAIVSAETVELMPVTEISEVIALQSGVVSSGGDLHFRGGRAREVTYIVDGIPVTNEFSQSGGNGVSIETNAIEELEVISGTFNAEYGSAQSGVVNIVTKRPAKSFKGNLQVYGGEFVSRHDDIFFGIDHINPTAEKDLQFSLTGPILKDKLGFFISGRVTEAEAALRYEQRFADDDGWVIAAYREWAQKFGSGGGGIINIPDSLATGDGSTGPLGKGQENSITAKLLFNPHSKVTMIYKFLGGYAEATGRFDPSYRFQSDGGGTARRWNTTHDFSFQHFPRENFFYNLAFSWQHLDGESFFDKSNPVAILPGQEGFPAVGTVRSAAGGFRLGRTTGFFNDLDGKNFQDKFVAIGSVNWQIDKHNLIKAGFEVNQHRRNLYFRNYRVTEAWQNGLFPSNPEVELFYLNPETDPSNPTFDEFYEAMLIYWTIWGSRFNPADSSFTQVTPRYEEASTTDFGNFRDYTSEPLEVSFYVQDKLELGNDIIVNAGVRLDYFQPNENVPISLRTESFNLGAEANLEEADTHLQLSPRLGISFPISSKGAFHASYGHFFQIPSFERLYNLPLTSITALELENITLGNANLKPEKTIAYEIGLQQGLTEQVSVDITAYYKDYRNLLGLERLTTIDRVPYNRFINKDYGNSKGITLGFTKNSGMVTGSINYTLSFADGSSSNETALNIVTVSTQLGGGAETVIPNQLLPLNWDQRQSVSASVNFASKDSWSLGLVGVYDSGQPFSPTFVSQFGLNENEYINAANKRSQWSVDLKAKKSLKFAGLKSSLFLKVDNLFDHLNDVNVFRSSGRSLEPAILPDEKAIVLRDYADEGLFTYEQGVINPNNFSLPRRVQLGLDISF